MLICLGVGPKVTSLHAPLLSYQSHLLFLSTKMKGSWGGHVLKRWVTFISFFVGADKSLWKSGNAQQKHTGLNACW